MEKNIVTRERERKKDQATEREKVFRRLTAARERATKRKRDLVGLEVVRARDGSCDDGGSWPATRKNEEIEYTTAVKRLLFMTLRKKDISGNDVSLSQYSGNVLLIVNVSSKW